MNTANPTATVPGPKCVALMAVLDDVVYLEWGRLVAIMADPLEIDQEVIQEINQEDVAERAEETNKQ